MSLKKAFIFAAAISFITLSASQKGVYEIKMYNNTPTMFMEGEPYFAPTSIQGNIHQKIVKGFAGQELHVYSLLCHFADDPQEIIKRMETVVKWDPKARFILRVGLLMNTKQATLKNPHAVKWFKENPPSANGENQATYLKLRTRKGQKLYSETPSVASEKWMAYAMPIYRNYIKALENSSCGSRIAIYWPAYHEGNYAYSFGGPVFFSDYSPSMIKKFRAMLKRKYKNNVNLLRKAWNEPKVTFETAEAATPEERLNHSSDMSLRNPLKHQKVIDFEQCLNEVITDYILTFLAETKKLTNRKKITGTYACYIGGWLSSGGDWNRKGVTAYRQAAGHLNVLPYYNSPDVDLIGSPNSYIWRGPGEATIIGMAHSSWQLRNKLFYWEDDTRTSVMALFDQVGSCKTIAESNEVLKRNFGYNLAKGYMYWIPGHYFGYAACDDPDIMTMLGKCREIGMQALKFERKSNADVALVIDDKSIYYYGLQPQMYGPLTELHKVLSMSGVDYDVILQADLANPKLKNYKFYVMLDSLYFTPERKKEIQKKFAANGASVLWFYAPGYVTDNGYSLKNVEDITGIKVEMERKYKRHHIRMTSDNKLFKDLKGEVYTFGTDASKKSWGPLFYINDPSAEILGVINENGKPGFAMKKRGNVTHFYSTAPGLGESAVRRIAEYAGAHVYNDKKDFVIPGKNFLVLHTAFDGEHIIKLPKKCDVYEVFDEKLIAKNVSQFKMKLPKGQTKLFFIGDSKLWKPGKKVVYVNSDTQTAARTRKNTTFARKVKAEKCAFVDLSKIAKYYNTNPKSKDVNKNIPVGKHVLGNVPFMLLDPAKGPICIDLYGKQHPYISKTAPDAAVGNKKVSYFYFLHQAGWMNRDYNTTTLEYIIKYTDGTQVRVPIRAHMEIADGVNGAVLKKTGLENPEAKVAHIYFVSKRYPNCAFYAYRFKNPYRRKTVKSIGFSSEKNTGMAVPAVYAITLELAQ